MRVSAVLDAASSSATPRRLPPRRHRIQDDEGSQTDQNDLGLVELLLNTHDRVGLLRVLVLQDVLVEARVVDEDLLPRRAALAGLALPLILRDLGRELVEDLVQEPTRQRIRSADACEGWRARRANGAPSVHPHPAMLATTPVPPM